MREILYCAERGFLEHYLKERAAASIDDFKALTDIYGNRINPAPAGSAEAVNEIYSVEGDAAHIRISGVLSPEGPDLWDSFYGYAGTAYGTIRAAMERARTDPAVRRVILDIDSHGGSLAGCDEIYQAHKALAAEKPTEARAGSFLASAAYYIAAPAGKILAASPTSEIGSIGVLVATYDWTKWEESIGIREVVITSSNAPDKRPDVSTEHGRSAIRARLDALERIFYSRITESRGVSAEHIAEHFGRGDLVVAQDPSSEHEDAIRAGMIDGLATDTAEAAVGENENAPRLIDEDLEKKAEKVLETAGFIPTPLEEFKAKHKDEIDALLAKSPLHEGSNTPAQAGKTQEGHMNLSEFLKENPAAVAEIDRLKSEAKAAGAEEAKAKHAEQVAKVLPIIQSAAYPANIKTIACNVLAGKEEMAAFTATVTVFDSNREAANSSAAQAQTAELGAVTGEAPSGASAEEKAMDAVGRDAIEKARAQKEEVGKWL